jgi:ABC-type amino acid transport substrate-binding protein
MKRTAIVLGMLVLLVACIGAQATYKLAVYDLPTAPILKELFAEIGKTAGVSFEVQTVPPPRGDYLVSEGQVDVQVPHIKPKDPAALSTLKFDFGQEIITYYSFVLFSNKAKKIDVAELKKGNPGKFVIETDTANVNFYGFTASPSTNVEASLQKVNDGKIDGFIHSQTTTDAFAKKMSLPNCRRSLFEVYDGCYTLPKGKGGGELDKLIAGAIKKLRASGKYDQIMGKLLSASKYNDWQP